ncbi:hypothetical protein IWX80_002992 [Flavobacterium sp. CAN_S2]
MRYKVASINKLVVSLNDDLVEKQVNKNENSSISNFSSIAGFTCVRVYNVYV